MIKPNRNLSTIFDFLVNRINLLKQSLASLCHTRVCIFCRATNTDNQTICQGCLLDLRWNTHHCPVCAEPSATDSNEVCGQCQSNMPAYDKIVTPLIYSFPINECIQRFKYQGQRRYAKPFCELLARSLSPPLSNQTELTSSQASVVSYQNTEHSQCFIAVPMTRAKRRQRHYNQSELLCLQLAKRFNICYQNDIVIKSRDTAPQAGLKKSERIKNLKNSFAYVANYTPKHVTIVDDVVTTGATAHTIALLLKEHGVEKVEVWALARTAKY
jgi:ComF family protein